MALYQIRPMLARSMSCARSTPWRMAWQTRANSTKDTPDAAATDAAAPAKPRRQRARAEAKAKTPYAAQEIERRRAWVEQSVSLEDLVNSKSRTTSLNVPYFDTFRELDPVLDFPTPRMEPESTRSQPAQLEREPDWDSLKFTAPTPEKEFAAISSTADASVGITEAEMRSLRIRSLLTKKVSNQTGKGKIRSFYSIAIAGNEDGLIGLGEGKDHDAGLSTRKASAAAVKNMMRINRFEDRTVPGVIDHKYHAVRMQIRSRPVGFGLRCNHFIYEVCLAAGIKDLSAKVFKSRNGMNTIKCFVEALQGIKDPADIAKERGRRLLNVEQVYHSEAAQN